LAFNPTSIFEGEEDIASTALSCALYDLERSLCTRVLLWCLPSLKARRTPRYSNRHLAHRAAYNIESKTFDRRAEKTIASKATMMDITELNDPAKAEAFLRETIDGLAETIARMEAFAEKKIQGYRESTPDHPELLLRLTRSVQEGLHAQTEPLRQYREGLVEILERAETIRKQIEEIKSTAPPPE
jgi:hypothetical protein